MKRSADRRTVLITASAAILAPVAMAMSSQPNDIHGAVTFRGSKSIPTGTIRIYLEDLSIQDKALRRKAETRIKSDGKSDMLEFSLLLSTRLTVSSTQQIVAMLEREDGWLLARGSVKYKPDLPINITLNTVMY